jgi:hypothetical protein
MARDYDADANAHTTALAQLGRHSEADRLHTAIATGSTGTEILMTLRAPR